MKGYKGTIFFLKDLRVGMTVVHMTDVADYCIKQGTHVILGSAAVDVEFKDTREKEIEAIEKQMENERAESQQRLNVMMGRIQQLRALEHD